MSINTGQSKRFVRIRESEWTAVSLAEDDIQSLMEVRSDWERNGSDQNGNVPGQSSQLIGLRQALLGKFEIRVNEAIGAITLPSTVLIVEPKIPLEHFNFIACRALKQNLKSRKDSTHLQAGDNFVALLASWTVTSIGTVALSGLHRDYKLIEEESASPRGKINLSSTSINLLRGKIKVRFEAEDHVLDNPLNRVLKAALQFVAGNPTLDFQLRRSARNLSNGFAEVGGLQRSDLCYPLTRQTSRFQEAFAFSKVLLSISGLSLNSGRSQSRSFLIKTPYLIEEGIRNILSEGLPSMAVHKPAPKTLEANFPISANPDLGFYAETFVTGDIKYKIAEPLLKRHDLMQASFFALAFGANRGLIIDFQDSSPAYFERVKISNVSISRIPWNISLGLNAEETESVFIEEVSTWLRVGDTY